MAGFVLRMLVVMGGLWLAAELVPGVSIQGLGTFIGAAIMLGIVNAVVRPLMIVLTLPVTLLTLGLFLFVINAATFSLVAWMFDNFSVAGFWPALFGSVVVGLTGWLAAYFIGPRGRIEVIVRRFPPRTG